MNRKNLGGPKRWLSHILAKGHISMRLCRRHVICTVFLAVGALVAIAAVRGQQLSLIPNGVFFPNPNGASQTFSTSGGGIDETGPFFRSLGTISSRSSGTVCWTIR